MSEFDGTSDKAPAVVPDCFTYPDLVARKVGCVPCTHRGGWLELYWPDRSYKG